MGWPLLEVEGVEADDVIGTLARQAEQAGMRVVISTGDKDIAQLVTPQVTLVNTMSNETLDVAGVEQKFGVPPERMIDYLTLIGDAVDNVPGVPKVGPKTAVKWLTQYGSLDKIVKNAPDIGGVVGENLRRSLDWLPQARELLTIKCDVGLPVQLQDLAPQPQDKAKLAELFDRFEFRTWRRELDGGGAPAASGEAQAAASAAPVPAPQYPRHYETVVTAEALEQWLARIEARHWRRSIPKPPASIRWWRNWSAFHWPSSRARRLHPRGPSLCRRAGAVVARARAGKAEALAGKSQRAKLGQNLKYDTHVFANHGIDLAGVAHDTLLQSYVLESHQRHDMDSLAHRILAIKTITYDEVTGKGAKHIGFEQVALERATEYAAEDADITLQLHQALYPQIAADEKLAVSMPTSKCR